MVLACDLPGFGGSDLPTRPRISAYAEDALSALDKLGVERYVLVGHSFGGAAATAMAERAPQLTAALVLLAPSRTRRSSAVVAAGLSKRGFHRRRVSYHGKVLVAWGDSDRLVPVAHAEAVLRALPQAELEVWPGMGHHPQHERLGPLTKLICKACAAGAEDAPVRSRRLAA